jgi:hypothetical protein
VQVPRSYVGAAVVDHPRPRTTSVGITAAQSAAVVGEARGEATVPAPPPDPLQADTERTPTAHESRAARLTG